MSIYADCELRDIEIRRTKHPGEPKFDEPILPKFIPEEAEKQYSVPPWKLDLVTKMIPYMMTEEDRGTSGMPDDSD